MEGGRSLNSREKSDLDLWLTATYGDQVQREEMP